MLSSLDNKYSFPTSKIKIYGDTNAKFPKKKKNRFLRLSVGPWEAMDHVQVDD